MCDTPCVDPEFLKGDANTKGGGGATYCFGRFPENCMKLKKKLNGGGGVFLMPEFPLALENLENLEKWEGIFQSGKSQGILNRLEKSGKITQNTEKLRYI